MAFIQNPNMDIWKKILFFMKPGSSKDVFMRMQIKHLWDSQIKLSLQHFKSEVFSMVTVYNILFCLTIKWKKV